MSRAETSTKLPLATWFKLMGIHPLHAMQVRLENTPSWNPENDQLCNDIYFQHEWQNNDHVSREEIARAIAEAESRIENFLGYRLAPTWEFDEWHQTIRPYQSDLINLNSVDIRGFRQIVQANWGHMISGGIQAKELVSAAAPIVYSDADLDTYFETATVTVPTVALDRNEIEIYYPGKDGDDAWQIRPTTVVISGGNATITFRRELVVIESKLEAYDVEGAEAVGTVDDDFLATVDVYRRYNDPQTQVSFLWEPFGTGTCQICTGDGCTSCAYAAQAGCLMTRGDPRISLVGYTPAAWDSTDNVFNFESWAVGRQPDIVRLFYYSGWRDKTQRYTSRLSPAWERTVAYYAAALLDRPPCDCSADVWRMWRNDLAMDSGDEDGKPIFRTPSGVLDNPFGTRRGMVNAWQTILNQSGPGQAIMRPA